MSCCCSSDSNPSSDSTQLKPSSDKEPKPVKDFDKFSKAFESSKKRSYPAVKAYAPEVQQYSSTFMEFLPENEENQKMYSAMSPSWVGEKKSSEALKKGAY